MVCSLSFEMHCFNFRLVTPDLKLTDFKFRSIDLTFVYIVFVAAKEWYRVAQHNSMVLL
jgi:hypothetical protein